MNRYNEVIDIGSLLMTSILVPELLEEEDDHR